MYKNGGLLGAGTLRVLTTDPRSAQCLFQGESWGQPQFCPSRASLTFLPSAV